MELDDLRILDFERIDDEKIGYYLGVLASQGGGWGYKPTDNMLLTLAERLATAEKLAKDGEGYHRALKGSQLENGRLRKTIRNLEQAQTALLSDLESARSGRQELSEQLAEHTATEAAMQATLSSLEKEVERLQNKLDTE